uniref:Uncharacterized protein n=1 Tax=Thermodesulfobacterium geofontis TaxID=1295609 RepID=A0A7C4NVJ4_9BACT
MINKRIKTLKSAIENEPSYIKIVPEKIEMETMEYFKFAFQYAIFELEQLKKEIKNLKVIE